MEDIFSQKVKIAFYDCDPYGRMKVSAVNKMLADLSDADYTRRGMSHQQLAARGYVFLLSKVSVRFARLPEPQEEIVLSTWERELKGATFFRSFAMHDRFGAKILAADSAWMLVNPETHQILRPKTFSGVKPTGIPADCPPCARLKLTDGVFVGNREIRYSDLDGNGHVYNAIYADIATDFLLPDTRSGDLLSYQVNFVHEAKRGDTLAIYRKDAQEIHQTSVIKGVVGEHDSFLCAFEYRPRP